MPQHRWTPDMATGATAIDADHQLLIHVVGLIGTCLEHEGNVDEALPIVEFLVDYVRFHFEREEAILTELDISGSEEHRRQHDVFRIRIRDLAKTARIELDRKTLGEIHTVLSKWIEAHVIQEGPWMREVVMSNPAKVQEILMRDELRTLFSTQVIRDRLY